MKLRWVMLLAAVIATLALLGAACGGDDDDGGADGAATATEDSGDGGDDTGDDETPEATADGDGDDDGGEGSSEDAVDACSLITKDEAEAALGDAVDDGEPGDFPPVYSCRYQTEDFDILDVTVVVYDDDETAEAAYEMVLDVNDYPEIGAEADHFLGDLSREIMNEMDLEGGMPPEEFRKKTRERVEAHARMASHRVTAGHLARLPPGVRADALPLGQESAGPRGEVQPRAGEPHSLFAPDQEGCSDGSFEPPDGNAERGLADPQALGRARDVLGTGHLDEVRQVGGRGKHRRGLSHGLM